VALDHGVVLLAVGAYAEAARALDRAASLGARGPELFEARALWAAKTGRAAEARRAGRQAATWEGRLLAAAQGDGASAAELGSTFGGGVRTAYSAAAIALYARSRGWSDAARDALDRAVAAADTSRAYELLVAARQMQVGLQRDRFGPVERAFARVGGGVATNPAWTSEPGDARAGAFAQVEVGVGSMARLGPVSLRARFGAQQRVYANDRGRLSRYDLTGLEGAFGFGLAIGRDPTAARLDLDARVTGAWADDLGVAVGSLLEVGPSLTFRVAPRSRLRLGFFGVRYDFDSALEPTGGGAPGDERDRVGQRAVIGVAWGGDVVRARLEGVFTAEQAETPSFDAIGGGFGGDVQVWATPRLQVGLEASAWVRDFGPTVAQGPVGSAESRAEVRSRWGLELAYRVAPAWWLRLRNDFVATFARQGSDYADNVTGAGVAIRW